MTNSGGWARVVLGFAFVFLFTCRGDRAGEVKEEGAVVVGNMDRIIVSNRKGSENVVALLHGRLTHGAQSCFPRKAVGADTVDTVNFLKAAGCPTDLTVFADANALYHERGLPWTDASGDVSQAILEERRVVPVKVWVLQGSFDKKKRVAAVAVTRAEELYNSAGCGMSLPLTAAVDLTDEELVATSCSDMAELSANGFWSQGVLNVYYTGLTTSQGENCPGWKSVIVSESADGETLAHELGHAATLEHTDGILQGDNIMTEGGGRTSATRGQCFRINLEPSSAVYELAGGGGHSRHCDAYGQTYGCPGLKFH